MTDKNHLLICIWKAGKFCEISAGAGTEKGQFVFGYDHKIMMEVRVYFKQEIHSNILSWPNRQVPLNSCTY